MAAVLKTVLLHAGRCGSTVIGEMLGDHPDVYWGGELLRLRKQRQKDLFFKLNQDFKAYLTHEMAMTDEPVYLFSSKPFLYEIERQWVKVPLEEYITGLKEIGVERFILFERQNYLRRTISAQIGHITKVSHTEKEQTHPTKIYYKYVSGLVEDFRIYDRTYSELKSLLMNESSLFFVYETDIAPSVETVYSTICKFLGLEVLPVKPKYHKTNPFPIKSMVKNYSKIRSKLKNTPYEWMFWDTRI